MRVAGLFALALIFPAFAFATELININTADATLLETLPGIGPAIAGRIIDHRTVNGPFATTEEIQDVKGIGPRIYEDIASLITVGDAGIATSAPGGSSASSTSPEPTNTPPAVPTESSSRSGSPEYVPIPVLRIVAAGDRNVSTGADTAFTATVYDSKGNRRADALITWSFGDGMRRTGANVYHKYYEPGEYLAVVRATTPDGGDERSEMIVMVKNADISIASVTPRGVSLSNSGTRTLDLSLWRIQAGGKEFKIPEDTHILAGHAILFPSQVIDLPFSGAAALLYPSGEVATVYPKQAPLPQQPFTPLTSFNQVQKVSPIISTNGNIQTHDDAVVAPTAQAELAAVGAVAAVAEAPIAAKEAGVFRSPWTLGLLGVILLAGSAFILL